MKQIYLQITQFIHIPYIHSVHLFCHHANSYPQYFRSKSWTWILLLGWFCPSYSNTWGPFNHQVLPDVSVRDQTPHPCPPPHRCLLVKGIYKFRKQVNHCASVGCLFKLYAFWIFMFFSFIAFNCFISVNRIFFYYGYDSSSSLQSLTPWSLKQMCILPAVICHF